MNELITIIVPCYNASKTVGACIESVLAQTYHNWELIIVDDGSTDDSYEILLKLAINDSRIRIVKQKNAGVSAARNTGIKMANGKYLAFLDADDWYSNDFIEVMYIAICKNNADVSCCGYCLEMGESSHDVIYGQGDICYQGEEYLHQILFGRSVRGFVCNKLIRIESVRDVRFSKDLKLCEDMMFCCDIYRNNIRMAYVDKAMYHYRIIGSGATQNDQVLISKEGGLQIINNYRLLEEHLPIDNSKRMVDRLCGESIINSFSMLNRCKRKGILKQIREVFIPFFFTDSKLKEKLRFLYAVLIISLKAR